MNLTTTSRLDQIERLEDEFGLLIRRVRRALWERARAVHPELQPATYLMLTHLARTGPQRASAIGGAMGVDKGAISRQIQHLLDLDLVTRSPDPDDGRATLVAASDEAVRRLVDVSAEGRRVLADRLGDWSDDELAEFVDGLARYNAATWGG